jgi:hypothetical protein
MHSDLSVFTLFRFRSAGLLHRDSVLATAKSIAVFATDVFCTQFVLNSSFSQESQMRNGDG